MHLKIIGTPIPQKRHRHSTLKNGNTYVYDPVAREKALVRLSLTQAIEKVADFTPYKHPVINFNFFMPIPRYLSLSLRDYANDGLVRHLVKPDVDNLIKFYLDVMNGIIYNDDKSICIGEAIKLYYREPHTEVIIKEMDEVISENSTHDDEYGFVECDGRPISTINIRPYSEDLHYSASEKFQ